MHLRPDFRHGECLTRIDLRVCAVRGASTVDVRERQVLGGRVCAERMRSFTFRQRTRCERHSLHRRVTQRFLGVCSYRVAATVWDRDGQHSRTVRRSRFTVD